MPISLNFQGKVGKRRGGAADENQQEQEYCKDECQGGYDTKVSRTGTFTQGSKGIRQSPINWCTSPIIKQQNAPAVDYNYWLKRLDTQLNKPTNQNSI